mmetsp:Transcript_41248/g.128582  ORF Transcript_41248/g.128582 Transcript_41248/m.128582 type:complete len:226 (+) Transcript_41248:1602-2279(+)
MTRCTLAACLARRERPPRRGRLLRVWRLRRARCTQRRRARRETMSTSTWPKAATDFPGPPRPLTPGVAVAALLPDRRLAPRPFCGSAARTAAIAACCSVSRLLADPILLDAAPGVGPARSIDGGAARTEASAACSAFSRPAGQVRRAAPGTEVLPLAPPNCCPICRVPAANVPPIVESWPGRTGSPAPGCGAEAWTPDGATFERSAAAATTRTGSSSGGKIRSWT